MNRLQNLAGGEDYAVTLGGPVAPVAPVDPGRVIDRMEYAHPAYTPASVAAQRRLPGLNTHVTAFAGACHGWGSTRTAAGDDLHLDPRHRRQDDRKADDRLPPAVRPLRRPDQRFLPVAA
jgi:predicted NAD/FAD-binding protein